MMQVFLPIFPLILLTNLCNLVDNSRTSLRRSCYKLPEIVVNRRPCAYRATPLGREYLMLSPRPSGYGILNSNMVIWPLFVALNLYVRARVCRCLLVMLIRMK